MGLGEMMDARRGRGVFGAVVGAELWAERLRRWVPAAIALVVLGAVAMVVAGRYGAASLPAILAYVLAVAIPGVWVVGTWVWDRGWQWVDRKIAMSMTGKLMRHIERGDAQLPVGSAEVAWDRDILRVTGAGHVVEVPWSDRPIVRRGGDRAVVIPFTLRAGAPDVGRMAVIRAEAFADRTSFESAFQEWSAYARG